MFMSASIPEEERLIVDPVGRNDFCSRAGMVSTYPSDSHLFQGLDVPGRLPDDGTKPNIMELKW
jgi:hypothetical protein